MEKTVKSKFEIGDKVLRSVLGYGNLYTIEDVVNTEDGFYYKLNNSDTYYLEDTLSRISIRVLD